MRAGRREALPDVGHLQLPAFERAGRERTAKSFKNLGAKMTGAQTDEGRSRAWP